jgi:hypothetical protein
MKSKDELANLGYEFSGRDLKLKQSESGKPFEFID